MSKENEVTGNRWLQLLVLLGAVLAGYVGENYAWQTLLYWWRNGIALLLLRLCHGIWNVHQHCR
jgi:hypothetical protein